jgi:YggT family protein
VQILAYTLIACIVIRVSMSWTRIDPTNPIAGVITEITEPILAPIRSILPRMGMIDLSPLIASFLLIFVAQAASRAFS